MSSSNNLYFKSEPQASLEIAIRANDPAAIELALSAGASANARGLRDVTPLMIAVDSQNPASVRCLLGAGADPNARAIDGNSPVSLAVEGHARQPHGRDVMLAVMRAGGNPDTLRADRDPVIRRFINDRDIEDLRLFAALGADLDILGRGDEPIITSVAMAQNWDMVWEMIQLGARVDYEGGRSTQPLSRSLSSAYPSPGSTLHDCKRKVWQFMKDKGLPVKEINR